MPESEGSFKVVKNGFLMVCRNWRQMAIYVLCIWIVNAAILAPAVSWVLKRLGTHGGDVIVGNMGIPLWLLSPRGILYIFVAGVVILLALVLPVSGLFRIARESDSGDVPDTRKTLLRTFLDIPRLSKLSLYLFLAVLVMTLPLAAGIGAIYLILLSAHDINYYLSAHPPAWHWAVASAAVWIIIWLMATASVTLRSIFAVPVWLESNLPFNEAVKRSWEMTCKSKRLLFYAGGSFFLTWLSASALCEGVLFILTGFILTRLSHSVNLIVYLLSTYLVAAAVLEAILLFVGIAWLVSIWVILYDRISEGTHLAPSGHIHSKKRRWSIPISWHTLLHPWITFALIALLLASSGAASAWILRNGRQSGPAPLVISHRAGAGYAPENTLSGLKKTITQGASDYIEIDVQMTRDSVAVVTHDRDLMRMAGDPRRIRETDYAELSEIDIGKIYHPDFKGERMGKLAEFLQLAQGGKARMMIEFKGTGEDGLVGETIRLIQKFGMENDVLLLSLDLKEVRQAQKLAPDMPVGYIVSLETGDLTRLDVDFMATRDKITTKELISVIHEQGIPVYCWTVDDKMRALELLEMGIDGIVTNHPPKIAGLIKRYRTLGPAQHALLHFRRFWNALDDMALWDTPTEPDKEQ